MPFDLRLVDGDIVIDPFDLQINTQGLESVAQRLAITLNAFKGEYFLNTEFGTPWFQTVLRKNASKNLIDSKLRSVINSVEGVLQILEYRSSFDRSLRCFNVSFKARIDEGVIDAFLDTGGGAPVVCVYNPPPGNNVIFISSGNPPSPNAAQADLNFTCG